MLDEQTGIFWSQATVALEMQSNLELIFGVAQVFADLAEPSDANAPSFSESPRLQSSSWCLTQQAWVEGGGGSPPLWRLPYGWLSG